MEQRLVVRDARRAPDLQHVEVAVASYGDMTAARAALDGIETLFMVSGSEAPDRVEQHRTFVNAAVSAGVERIVYLSFYGASQDATFTLARDHWATEEHIRDSGLTWTFLRDNLYLDFLPSVAGDDGVIRGPAGNGRVAAVAIDDVADAAAAVLRHPEAHGSTAYRLTGPQALTLSEVADVMSEQLGRRFVYEPETLEEAYASRSVYDAPDWQVEAWVTTYTAIAAGELAEVTEDVERLTGHPPRSLRQLLT